MDIIYLHDLKIECIIGIWEWERRIKQTIILDLDMAADIRRAAASDKIEDSLNYKAVSKRLVEFVGNSQFHLVETLAEKVAEILLAEFKLQWVRVRINKKGAVRELATRYAPLALSPVYESKALGFEGENFFNLVAGFDSDESIERIKETLSRIESRLGRVHQENRFSSRTLDLDLLLYGDTVRHDDKVNLPHPDIQRYAFVLHPLADIAPELRHPETGLTCARMWQQFDAGKQELWKTDFDPRK
jgi:FolB domain-containing protein